ncbi:unnamed protein product [Merluccius merluccius]
MTLRCEATSEVLPPPPRWAWGEGRRSPLCCGPRTAEAWRNAECASLAEIATAQSLDKYLKEVKDKMESDERGPKQIGWEMQQDVLYQAVPTKGRD